MYAKYTTRDWGQRKFAGRYTLSWRQGVYLPANFRWLRSRVVYHQFYYGSYDIYFTAWADYVNGSVSGIAIWINEDTGSVIVRAIAFWLEWMSLSMLRILNHPRNISAVKAELKPWRRTFCSCRLETKMLLVLGHDANGHLSLLPSRSRKLPILKQCFQLSLGCPASQFCWQWWQQLVKYKLVLALSWISRLANRCHPSE